MILVMILLIACDGNNLENDKKLVNKIKSNLKVDNTVSFVTLVLTIDNTSDKQVFIPCSDWVIDKFNMSNPINPGIKNTIHFINNTDKNKPIDIGWKAKNEYYPKVIEINKNQRKNIWLFVPKKAINKDDLTLYEALNGDYNRIAVNFSIISKENYLKIINCAFSIKNLIFESDSIYFPINYITDPNYTIATSNKILDSIKSFRLNKLLSNRITVVKDSF